MFISFPFFLFSKVFKGPQIATDTEMIVNFLRHPIEANSIRLRPKTWFEQICLRMELYGCDILGSPGKKSRYIH